jgi:hypothetical protein
MWAKVKKWSSKCSSKDPSLQGWLKVEKKPHDTLAVMETTYTASTTLLLWQTKGKTSTSDSKAYCLKVMKGTGLRLRTS